MKTFNEMKNAFFGFLLFSPAVLFISCAGDCKNVRIEKAEWITRYENYTVDTLVRYSVEKNNIRLLEYRDSDNGDKVTHTITIHNHNASFSNYFSLKIDSKISYSNLDSTSVMLDYIEIQPNTSETLTYQLNGPSGKKDFDYDNFITILQLPQQVKVKRQIDELKTETITVNTCQQSVEALQERYKTIKKLYHEKVRK